MRTTFNLRLRAALAFAGMGIMVSLALSLSLYVLILEMENRLLMETLAVELEDYVERFERNPQTPPPRSTSLRSLVLPRDEEEAPAAVKGLPQGFHSVTVDERDFFVQVHARDGQRFMLLFDAERIHHRERQFRLYLGIGSLVMTIFAALLGYWMAGRVIAPVVSLSKRIAALTPDESQPSLRSLYSADEVGALAREFDRYRERLAAFIDREQAFTADVSHELRTPLTVIEGAVEVILGDPSLSDSHRGRVERIGRSLREMSEIVAALLLLAREEASRGELAGCSAPEAARQVISMHTYLLRQHGVHAELQVWNETELPVECTLLRIVLGNLLRNAVAHTVQGRIIMRIEEHQTTVVDTGTGIETQDLDKIFDRFYSGRKDGEGIGLSLVKRICLLYGWEVRIDSAPGRGALFRLLY